MSTGTRPCWMRWKFGQVWKLWYDREQKLMVQYSQMLVTIHSFALFLHWQSTLSKVRKMKYRVPPDHQLLDSAPNFGPLISCWEINKFENCWYKSVRFLEVLKLLFQQFLNLSSSQWDMSGPIFGNLSNNRWSGGTLSKVCISKFWCVLWIIC